MGDKLAGKGAGGVGGDFGEQDDTRKLNHIFPKIPKARSAINLIGQYMHVRSVRG